MYQRAAKKKPAMVSNDGMSTVTFFRIAKEELQNAGYEDEAFYFEQVKDYLKDGGELDPKKAARALGL